MSLVDIIRPPSPKQVEKQFLQLSPDLQEVANYYVEKWSSHVEALWEAWAYGKIIELPNNLEDMAISFMESGMTPREALWEARAQLKINEFVPELRDVAKNLSNAWKTPLEIYRQMVMSEMPALEQIWDYVWMDISNAQILLQFWLLPSQVIQTQLDDPYVLWVIDSCREAIQQLSTLDNLNILDPDI